MKKYNTPEIEALALETVDVIATSGNAKALEELQKTYTELDAADVQNFAYTDLSDTWSW